MGANSLPETATRQRRDCDLNPGPSEPESSTLTTRLPSHPEVGLCNIIDAARIVCGAESMKRYGVRPSLCPIDRQQQRRPAGLLLSAVQAGDIDR